MNGTMEAYFWEVTMKLRKKNFDFLVMTIFSPAFVFLTACDPVTVALGGSALAGTTMVGNEEGISGSISDTNLQTKVNAALLEAGDNLVDRVEFCIKHGMVVVIGYLKNEDQRIRVMNIVRNVKCYHAEIYDETKVQEPPTPRETVSDTSITTRIKSALKFDGNVSSLNYDITTVKGVVYICGTAMSKFEREVVINQARSTSGVTNVVAYIKVKPKKNQAKVTENKG